MKIPAAKVAIADGQKMTPEPSRRALSISKALAGASRTLGPRLELPRLEAEILLCHVLGVDRAALMAHPETELGPEALARFEALIARRAGGEPAAYLTGRKEFWSLDLEVSREVLIPRPETEHLVAAALERIPPEQPTRVADLGTGCGAIALAIGRERPRASIVASDICLKALSLAQKNARRNASGNVLFLASDWLRAMDVPAFDLIVSNPPYVRDSDPHLRQGDLPSEPRLALAAGAEGLDAIRIIVAGAMPRLARQGALILEHGFDQGPAVRRLLQEAGFCGIFTLKDYAGHERVSGGRR